MVACEGVNQAWQHLGFRARFNHVELVVNIEAHGHVTVFIIVVAVEICHNWNLIRSQVLNLEVEWGVILVFAVNLLKGIKSFISVTFECH